MNTGICEKCGTTIPLRTLGGEPRSEHACQICDPPKQAQGKKGCGGIFVHLVVIVGCALAGLGLQKCSFDKVAEIRQFARVPQTDVRAAVPGEIKLLGAAEPLSTRGPLLSSPDTGSSCLYFRYLVEREERDSDGDTRWVTEIDRAEFVPQFLLRDGTGEIAIRPNARVDFNVPRSHYRTAGSRRYSEFRLDPRDVALVFGYAEPEPEGDRLVIGFDGAGDYQPLISEKTEFKERTGRATTSIIACWAGLVLIGVTTAGIFSLTGRHRLLAYFWVLSMSVGAVLVFLGFAMMRSDLRRAHEHVVRQEQTVKKVIAAALRDRNIAWGQDWETLGDVAQHPQIDEEQRLRLRRVRIDLATASRRVRSQSEAFPYNLVVGSKELEELPQIPLPAADEATLAELESSFKEAKLSGFGTWLWGIGGLAGAFVLTGFGFRSVRVKRMTENLATSPTAGVAYGLTELVGVIDLPDGIDPLLGPLSRKPCVSFDYRIEERRGSGKDAKWVEIHREDNRCLFLCRDREGTFPIDPHGAEVSGWRRDIERQGRLRYTETRLQFGDPLYAIGMAEIDPDTGDSLYLCKPDMKDEPFVLSSFTERAVVAKRGIRAIAWLTGAFASVLLAGLMLFASRGAFSPADYLAAALVGPAYLVVLTLILHYNDLVFLRQRARRNWSNIEVSMRKRYDLVPAMIDIAKAYMAHEEELQTRLATLRGGYAGGVALDPGLAGQLLQEGQVLGGMLMGKIEDNPELQAATQTALVIRQLVALEDEIAFMRAGYNDAVQQYNTRIAVFPDSLLAKIGKFRAMDLLDYHAEVIPMPEIAQETWRRKQLAETVAAPTNEADLWSVTQLPSSDPESPIIEAREERAYLYASLLDETGELRQRQIELIAAAEGEGLAGSVAQQIDRVQAMSPWDRLSQARTLMPRLRNMSAEKYLRFKGVARQLIEADDRLNTYEYAFEKALAFLVDPSFTPAGSPEIRHTGSETLTGAIAALRQHLSDPSQEHNLGTFDAAMADVFHAIGEVRNAIYRQCYEAFVGAGGEPDSERFLLIQSLSDGLFLGSAG